MKVPILDLAAFTRLGREANLIVLAVGLASIPFGYLTIIQPIYLKSIGIDEASIGIILSVSTLTTSLLIIPFGILSDRYSKRWILIFGESLTALAWLIYAVLVDIVAFYTSAFIRGLGSAAIFAPLAALLAEKTSKDNRTVAFSLSSFASMAGSTAGAMASGIPDWIMRELGSGVVLAYRPLFWASLSSPHFPHWS